MAPPALPPRQAQLLRLIEAATRAARSDIVAWRSEWSGYPPFGAACWLECAGEDVSRDFPSGWSEDDLRGLEAAGALAKLDERRNPDDEFERRTSYRVTTPEAGAGPDALSGS